MLTYEPAWIQLPDEEVAEDPEEVLAVFEGPEPQTPIEAVSGKSNRDQAIDWAKQYVEGHPNTTYSEALNGKGSAPAK